MRRVSPNERLIAEAKRLNDRYQIEIVEALNLCPWAARARQDGATEQCVLLQAEPDPAAVLDIIDELEPRSEIEVGFVIFPRLQISAPDFETFISTIVRRDAERRPLKSSPFALAAFHPEAAANTSKPERLIPYLRRTPDPTAQLVRVSALERVRKGDSDGTSFVDVRTLDLFNPPKHLKVSLRKRIATANLETIEELGLANVEERIRAIHHDRERSYREL